MLLFLHLLLNERIAKMNREKRTRTTSLDARPVCVCVYAVRVRKRKNMIIIDVNGSNLPAIVICDMRTYVLRCVLSVRISAYPISRSSKL